MITDAIRWAAAVIVERSPRESAGVTCENVSQSRRLIVEAVIRALILAAARGRTA